ncbi:MAG: LysM peptidoglycan-binding domain-containing protein, partial [Candidatus Cloacimonetes bacterium]|nr:LysM peptidoglycan-binding domain-containing protein [Candidatus Cloacimonadota bacterium]
MRISASAFRVTVLIWLVLVIPILLRGVSYQTHTVKAGDTLYGLSRSNGVSIDKLKELNGLSSDRLSIGQVLKIKALPDPAPATHPKPAPKPAPVTPVPDKDVSTPGSPTTNQDPTAKDELPDEYFYTVQRKDNLYRISL